MKGFAALPMVISLGFVIAVVAAAFAFWGVSEITQSGRQKDADIAFFVAEAGADDAKIRIARDLTYSNAGGYNLVVGNGTTTVIVQKDSFSSPCTATGASGKHCIVSTGTVASSKRRVEVVTTISNNGKVSVDSFKEIAP